jgi:hypothetical protein
MRTVPRQRRWTFDTPAPYVGIALLSLLSSLAVFVLTLLLGIIIGTIGSLRGALSTDEPGRIQGVHILFAGLALLVGPSLYLLLALFNSN